MDARPLNMAKIALTGANSFLCSLFLKKITEESSISEVHVFDIKPSPVTSKKIIFHRVDLIRDNAPDEISSILKKENIDIFIHGALFSGPTRNGLKHHELETIGTFNVLNACADAQIKKLIINSATFVYNALPGHPNFIHENTRLKHEGPKFVKSRVDAENQIADFIKYYPNCHVTILRFAPILGPNATNVRARYFLSEFVPKLMGYDPLLQFIHEEDALKALMIALFSSEYGTFNIVGKGVIPLSTAVHMAGIIPVPILSSICKTLFAAGYASRVWELSHDLIPFFQYICVGDGNKAKEILKFEAQFSSRQALKSMIEAGRISKLGFEHPSFSLGEEKEVARNQGFYRIN